MTSTRVAKSNPKFPTLYGYRMRALWQRIRIEVAHLRDLVVRLERRRGLLRDFRSKWGNSPPRSEAQWRAFWLELMTIEDQVDAVRREAQVVTKEAITRRAQAALKHQTSGCKCRQVMATCRHLRYRSMADDSTTTIYGCPTLAHSRVRVGNANDKGDV